MPVIEAENVSYSYNGGAGFDIFRVKKMNFSIEKNQIIGVIGHTGSGKSTLAQLLNGLIKPTEGKILLNGKNLWEDFSNIREVHFKVGLTFQYPEHQLFKDTVYDDIAFGPINQGLSKQEVNTRVLNAAEFAGISKDILQRSPFDLSGGEKRRTAIAGIIAIDPEVLILDEPTSGLDPIGRREILESIYNYHNKKKNVIIFISHIMEDIAEMCDKVMVLDKGNLEMFDTPMKVFSNSSILSNLGLEVPQITRIMKIVHQRTHTSDETIIKIDDAIRNIIKILDMKRM